MIAHVIVLVNLQQRGIEMRYVLKLVKKGDNTKADKLISDEEDFIVFSECGEYLWLASEFFNIEGEMEFEVK